VLLHDLDRRVPAHDHLPDLCGVIVDRLVEGTRRYEDVVARADFDGLFQPLADEETPVAS
jgi:hypothetical protein